MPAPDEIADELRLLREALEAHPNGPFTVGQIEALHRVTTFVSRVDTLCWWGAWFFGWGKWVFGFIVAVVISWEKIEKTIRVWGGQ